jgi:hypothetical protein
VTQGLFLFGLPDMAMPLGEGVDPASAVNALGELKREMIAEGWWPESGATFSTELGSLRMERLDGGLFVVPQDPALAPAAVATARYRFALELATLDPFTPTTRHRVTTDALVADHLLRADGGIATTVGVGLSPQRGGSAEAQNERVEVALQTTTLGPWATQWLEWIADVLANQDGSSPLKPFDRVVMASPAGEIAGVVLWPRAPLETFGETVEHWTLIPFNGEELARFRSGPNEQAAWLDEIKTRLPEMFARWSSVSQRKKMLSVDS